MATEVDKNQAEQAVAALLEIAERIAERAHAAETELARSTAQTLPPEDAARVAVERAFEAIEELSTSLARQREEIFPAPPVSELYARLGTEAASEEQWQSFLAAHPEIPREGQ